MKSGRADEYFRRWPEPEHYPPYEDDAFEGDPERLQFILDSEEEDQIEIFRRMGTSEGIIKSLFDL